MSKPTDFDEEVLAIVEDVGASLDQLADLDDDQREEMGALMETLGYDEAASIVRPTRRGLLKSGATGAAALVAGGLMGTAATDRATAGTQSTGTWGGPSDVQDLYVEDIFDSGDNNPMSFPGDGSVSIGTLGITNETFVEASRSSTAGSNSSGSWVNIVDTEDEDVRDEFNSSQQFSPDVTGKYDIIAQWAVRNGGSSDRIGFRVRNITDGTNAILKDTEPWDASSFAEPHWSATVELNSSKTYEIQVTDKDSSFEVNDSFTKLVIRRSVVHP